MKRSKPYKPFVCKQKVKSLVPNPARSFKPKFLHMKQFQSLGTSLSKEDLRKITGGMIAAQQGYELVGSNCFSDYQYVYPDGSYINYCGIACASTCCSPSMPCGMQIS